MRTRDGSRTLEIDGDTVIFEIDVAGNVASVGEGERLPVSRPFLGYRLVRGGEIAREGVLTSRVCYPGTVEEQFSDEQLRTLYRDAAKRFAT